LQITQNSKKSRQKKASYWARNANLSLAHSTAGDVSSAAVSVTQNKSNNHTHNRSHRSNSCRADQNTLAMLLEPTRLWLGLAALRFQEKLTMEPAAKVYAGLCGHQYPLEFVGQIQ
jgi:hypothetical protein